METARIVVEDQQSWPAWPSLGKGVVEDVPRSFGLYGLQQDFSLADLALKRLKKRLADRVANFDALVPLAEIREMRGLIDYAARETMFLVKRLRDLKRGRLDLATERIFKRYLRESHKKAADAWLTYSFAIKPILNDIDAAGKAISSYLTRYDFIDRLTGSASKRWNVEGPVQGWPITPYGTVEYKWTGSASLGYKYICGHKFLLESANSYDLPTHLGVTFPRFLPALYEATVFSWVFDYFTTAGEYLDDVWTGSTGTSVFVVECRKFRFSGSTVSTYKPYDPVTTKLRSMSDDPGVCEYFEFSRTSHPTLPPRVLRFKTLDEMGLNGVNKLLNLVSVLAK